MATPKKKKGDDLARDVLAQARASKTLADLGTLNELILDQLGGPAGFARTIKETLDDEDTTPSTRAKILADVLGLQQAIARTARDNTADDLGLLSDDDIDRTLVEMIREATAGDDDPPARPDQTPEEAPPPPAPGRLPCALVELPAAAAVPPDPRAAAGPGDPPGGPA